MSKKKYLVRHGVDWVNGGRVSSDRKVDLTDDEARFDLDLDRIVPVSASTSKKPEKSDDL
jgi:hypothetical protein